MYIDFNKGNNKEDPKFKVGDNVRISKYKNIFVKGFVPNWTEEVIVIKKVKNTVSWTYLISDLNPIQNGAFRACSLMGQDRKAPPP